MSYAKLALVLVDFVWDQFLPLTRAVVVNSGLVLLCSL